MHALQDPAVGVGIKLYGVRTCTRDHRAALCKRDSSCRACIPARGTRRYSAIHMKKWKWLSLGWMPGTARTASASESGISVEKESLPSALMR